MIKRPKKVEMEIVSDLGRSLVRVRKGDAEFWIPRAEIEQRPAAVVAPEPKQKKVVVATARTKGKTFRCPKCGSPALAEQILPDGSRIHECNTACAYLMIWESPAALIEEAA